MVVFSYVGTWFAVVVVDEELVAFAAMASTITTGEFSTNDDDEDVLVDVVVVATAAVVATEISVEEKLDAFRTGIGDVGVIVDDASTGGNVGNGVADESTSDSAVAAAKISPCSFINCPWEGVAYPHTTLT